MIKKIFSNMTRKQFAALTIILICTMYSGCAESWTPSDNEAVKIVKSHYLFYDNGETVQATVVKRGELLEICDCYPITFKIIFSSGRENNKTFYFYRNATGALKAKEFMGRNVFTTG